MAQEKTILIMRHAKSSWEDSSLRDFDRPLNKRGRRDAPAMGEFLNELGILPDYVVCSAAKRARQTLEGLLTTLEIDPENIQYDDALYYEGVEAYLDAIRSARSESGVVLVAGHNPTVEETVRRLSGGNVQQKITTANIACFYSSASAWEDVSERNTSFKWLTGPKDLSD